MYIPSGRLPARGWILLKRSDYEAIDPYSTSLNLWLTSYDEKAQTVSQMAFQNLTVVQARSVATGVEADPEAPYLVEITDKRGVLSSPWVQFSTNSQYNIRSPAYPQNYYSLSLASGSPWTWANLTGDLWTQMPLLGAFPGLPSVPSGTPEGWLFPGVSCFDALNDILDYLGLVLTCDLTSAAPYGIASLGAADTSFETLLVEKLPLLGEDMDYIDGGSGRVPSQVVVYFHRRAEYFGQEETVRRDGYQWSSTPAYSKTFSAPAAFSGSAGTHGLWSGFTVRFDRDGIPLASDVATANTVGQSEVDSYFAQIFRQTLGYMDRTYEGLIPFTNGSQVDGVSFFQRDRVAWRTRIWRGFVPEELRGRD